MVHEPLTYPDESHPIRTKSLRGFNNQARKFLQPPAQIDNFLNFVLAGRDVDSNGNSKRYIAIAPAAATDTIDTLPRTITRDFDSMIGTSRDLPYLRPLGIYPLPNFSDTVNKSTHLTVSITITVSVS